MRQLSDAGAGRWKGRAGDAVTARVEVVRVRGVLVINLLRFFLEVEVDAVEIFLDPHRLGLVDHYFSCRWLSCLTAAIPLVFLAWLRSSCGLSLRCRFR